MLFQRMCRACDSQAFSTLKFALEKGYIIKCSNCETIEKTPPVFHYSSYWGTWSRLLSSSHPNGPFVELNLTPIPDALESSWEKDVRPIRFRFHGTFPGNNDKITLELPEQIKGMMAKNLGEELVGRLLGENFLPQLDYELYRKHGYLGGGCTLEQIQKRSRQIRLMKIIEKALVNYQETGRYMDADGKTWTNSEGIIRMWEELES